MMGADGGGTGMTSEDLRMMGRGCSALVESEPEGLGRAGGYECKKKKKTWYQHSEFNISRIDTSLHLTYQWRRSEDTSPARVIAIRHQVKGNLSMHILCFLACIVFLNHYSSRLVPIYKRTVSDKLSWST
jgi:hypothetical protein